MCLFPNFLKIKVNILKAYVGAEGLRLLLMTSAIFPVSGFLVSLLLLGNDRQKPDMSLFTAFSQPYLICQTFPSFLWLAALHTRHLQFA